MASSATKKKKSVSKVNITPLGDRVVVQPEEAVEQTAGGIFLPDSAQEKPLQGTIVAVGPGGISRDGSQVELTVKVGDKVLFTSYGGADVKIDGGSYKICREADLLAVIE